MYGEFLRKFFFFGKPSLGKQEENETYENRF
jgi:hypothetical protein